MATLMSCHSYFTAGVLAVDYTEILRSLHEGGLVSDRAKREIESSAAITGWSCINHHFYVLLRCHIMLFIGLPVKSNYHAS